MFACGDCLKKNAAERTAPHKDGKGRYSVQISDTVSLRQMTPQMYHAYFREYQNDPELLIDKKQFKPFSYTPKWVDEYIQRQLARKRLCFAVMLGDEIAGEIILKDLRPRESAVLSICMKNDRFKGWGYGTQAERLAADYVFHSLDIPVLYADSILPNLRSQHVLEKAGFRLLRTEGDFKYYSMVRQDRAAHRLLLATCFEAFGGEAQNASAQALELLPEQIGNWTILKYQLPVVFGQAGEQCLGLIETLKPDAVLMLGQAGGREAVTPELLARNVRWARIPDNAGNEPKGEPVVPGGEDALFATLPVEAMTEAIRAASLPGALSATAGLYVCNDLYYSVLHRLRGTGIPAAFVHVPSAQTLSSERSARALEAAVTAIDEKKGTVE